MRDAREQVRDKFRGGIHPDETHHDLMQHREWQHGVFFCLPLDQWPCLACGFDQRAGQRMLCISGDDFFQAVPGTPEFFAQHLQYHLRVFAPGVIVGIVSNAPQDLLDVVNIRHLARGVLPELVDDFCQPLVVAEDLFAHQSVVGEAFTEDRVREIQHAAGLFFAAQRRRSRHRSHPAQRVIGVFAQKAGRLVFFQLQA